MTSYMITGANRGLGLMMVDILASKPSSEVRFIIAAVRNSSVLLDDISARSGGRVIILNVDISDEYSVQILAAEVAKLLPTGLDVLINNAGIMHFSENTKLGVEAMDNLSEHLKINVNSVHLVSRALLPLLRKGSERKIVNVSSIMGSITRAKSFMFQPAPAYKISKAALNMLTTQYALYLQNEEFTVCNIDPGWARTDMGSGSADLDPRESADCLLQRVASLTKEDNGKFFDANVPSWTCKEGPNLYNGEIIPW